MSPCAAAFGFDRDFFAATQKKNARSAALGAALISAPAPVGGPLNLRQDLRPARALRTVFSVAQPPSEVHRIAPARPPSWLWDEDQRKAPMKTLLKILLWLLGLALVAGWPFHF